MVGVAVYTTGLAEALVQRGHTVEVIAGKPYYPSWSVPEAFRGGWRRRSVEQGVVLTRVAHYVPVQPSGLKRLLHHASFALSSLVPTLMAARRMRPDVVLTVAPSLIAAPVATIAAALSGAKSWLHIQDFEVEAAMATGLINNSNWSARAARWFERKVLSLFDRVSSISPAMCRKLSEKNVQAERVVEFRNWTDVAAVTPLSSPSPYREEWGITTRHVALYSGNISNKQGIGIVVAAARRLRHRADLTFVVCGEGPNRRTLEAMASDLDNIVFHDLQPASRLQDLFGLASVHLLPQLAGAADLVLPSKLINMLASGRPVVATAAPGTGLADEVDDRGLVVPPNDDVAFAAAIERFLDDDAFSVAAGAAARRRAEEHWEQGAILGQLEADLIALVRGAETTDVAGTPSTADAASLSRPEPLT
jgi:colanic acid biosynthesis glycosyl transferase WcaI